MNKIEKIDEAISNLSRLINNLGLHMYATDNQDMSDAIVLLREYKAALAEIEKIEPVGYISHFDGEKYHALLTDNSKIKTGDKLYTEPLNLSVNNLEPVAWIKPDFQGMGYAVLDEKQEFKFSPSITKHEPIPLYTLQQLNVKG